MSETQSKMSLPPLPQEAISDVRLRRVGGSDVVNISR
jgi:hypothetical protein